MISKESRKRRLKYLITSLVLPLVVLITVVALGWNRYSYLFSEEKQARVLKSKTTVEYDNKQDITSDKNNDSLPEPKDPSDYIEKETPQSPPTTTTTSWWKYPANIMSVTKSGDDLLVLVNKEYKLPSTYVPSGLVHANTSGIRVTTPYSYNLRNIVITDLKALNDAAKAEGLNLSMISGYRSYSAQSSTYTYWVNQNNGNNDAVDQISARPGHSQHQLGTAMDFSSSEIGDRLGDEFTNTKAGKWLAENAWKYGFVISYPKGYESVTKYSYESWHYRYIGRENAQEMKNSGMILETWLKLKNGL